jgi:hypothetical protein
VPRRDCIPHRGRSHEGTGGDHHAARRLAQQEENLARERAVEAAARLDRRADDDELCAALGRDASNFLAEAPRPRPDDLLSHRDAVRRRYRSRGLEPLLEGHELTLEVRVERQLELEDCRSDEHDAGAAVGREPAGEVERVLGLFPVEQRHDDAPIRDRARPAREPPGAAVEQMDVRQLHRMSW